MRALVTSGGGAKGAFSVGALELLFEKNLGDFDLISGTSTGSLIAIFAAVKDLNTLLEEYTTSNTPDILSPQNILQALLTSNFLYDTLPLQEKIKNRVSDDVANEILAMNTTICLTSVALKSGRITVFTTKELNLDTDEFDQVRITSPQMLRDAMLASSSQAVFLKPVQMVVEINGVMKQDLFVDGGHRDVLPTRVPVLLGYDEIVVLSNNPVELFTESSDAINDVLGTLTRTIAIFIQEIRATNYRRISEHGIKAINIAPDTELDDEFPTGLRFDQNLMINWMEQGRRVAERALRDGGFIV